MGKNQKPETVSVVASMCKCEGCKKQESTFTFCGEHYDWYKFGLITKMGKKVSDLDKKYTHYQAYQEKQKTYKAA